MGVAGACLLGWPWGTRQMARSSLPRRWDLCLGLGTLGLLDQRACQVLSGPGGGPWRGRSMACSSALLQLALEPRASIYRPL